MISRIREYGLNQKIVSIVIYNSRTKTGVYHRLCYDNKTSEQNEIREYLLKLDLGKILFNDSPDENEIVRYCNAMIKYANSGTRFQDIVSDLSYGFFLIRNNNWVKNRYQYLSKYIAYKEIFVRVMQKVKNWTPEDFTIKQ